MTSLRRRTLETISKEEFQRLCDEIYVDRLRIHEFNPNLSRREAVLWMLMGCLISLLSVTDEELERLAAEPGQDTYGHLVGRLVRTHAAPPFDPSPCLERLSKSVENDQGLSSIKGG